MIPAIAGRRGAVTRIIPDSGPAHSSIHNGFHVPPPNDSPLPVEQRQTIFLALVEVQDSGQGVAAARAEISRRFEVSEAQVRAIETEGLDEQWPPLG